MITENTTQCKPSAYAKPTAAATTHSVSKIDSDTRVYAVKGFLEYEAVLPIGGTLVRILFSGGSATGYGSSPATFCTSSRVMQHIIENSSQFLNGFIFRRR